MLPSRASTLAKLFKQIQNVPRSTVTQQLRNSAAWGYRCPPAQPSRKAIIISTSTGAFMWWWMLWHICTEPEHITGEYPIVEPSLWTNEELGIPPDSEGSAPRIK